MSDTELQAARRRYEATGRVEDEAELLAAELRIGELDLSRLLLAAGLGHPAARRLAPVRLAHRIVSPRRVARPSLSEFVSMSLD